MPRATPVFDITPKTSFPLPNRAFFKQMAAKTKKELDKLNFTESRPLDEVQAYVRAE